MEALLQLVVHRQTSTLAGLWRSVREGSGLVLTEVVYKTPAGVGTHPQIT
jgi:hypothetical protein